MKQCQYYPQNNRNCSDCRMNMEQERGISKIAIAAFDKYYLLLVIDNRREDWMGNAATSKGYVEIEVNHELQKKLHFRSWLLGLNFKVHGLCCV